MGMFLMRDAVIGLTLSRFLGYWQANNYIMDICVLGVF
jgi:hypothetical protein